MKKNIGTVLLIAAIAVLAGCTKKEENTPPRFILSNAYYTAPFCAAYNASALATAKALGVELTILDGNGNQQTQLEHANMAIADGYDGFMYFPADVEGALPVIELLNGSGIPWVGVNAFDGNEIDKAGMKYYIGAGYASFGHAIADGLKEQFPRGARIVAIEGTAGHSQTIEINRALDEDLNSTYVFLDRQDCHFQAELAMTKTTDMLTAYGLSGRGGKIDCIISHDDGMLTGVISALEAQGIQSGEVAIFATGSNNFLYNALKTGWLSATATQDPVAEAKLAVGTMYQVLKGNAAPGWTKLPTPVAYPDTADQFSWY